MLLPEDLKQAFWMELKAYEEQRQMPYITSVEQIGFQRGKKEGRQEGRQEGQQEERRSLILLLLNQKFGPLAVATTELIAALDLQQLQALAIALLSFTTVDDLTQWLENHS
jgi:predicted transposase YdaD